MKISHITFLCSCGVLLVLLTGCSTDKLHYHKQYYSPTVAREHTDLRNSLNDYTFTGHKNGRFLGSSNFNIDTWGNDNKDTGIPFILYNDKLQILKDSHTGMGSLGSSNNTATGIYENNDTDNNDYISYALTKNTLIFRRSMPGSYHTLDYVKYRLHDIKYGEYKDHDSQIIMTRLKKYILYPEIVKRSGEKKKHLSKEVRKRYPLILVRNKHIKDSNYQKYHDHTIHSNTVP